ncbi:hypothetical protein GOP47_0019283 [Adiantum capillus-veneris]|uniref:Uncharacterized protein n=1 Tax=Adiantum capillus-veneris TaxID=13818 RepID=A0A9D4UFZ2_ADICA|nr:hypothetical protein GOP47_0019283 [Adiantum capillus-veneris]
MQPQLMLHQGPCSSQLQQNLSLQLKSRENVSINVINCKKGINQGMQLVEPTQWLTRRGQDPVKKSLEKGAGVKGKSKVGRKLKPSESNSVRKHQLEMWAVLCVEREPCAGPKIDK